MIRTALPLVPFAALIASIAASPAAARNWQPVEKTVTYPVSGDSGMALYRSIGESGPATKGLRAIAHTGFDLLWTRRYRPQADGSCVLAVATPHLTITTTLPKASGSLSPSVQASWDRFVAGIRDHEAVHAGFIVDLVERVQAYSLGLSAPSDPDCNKVRAKLQARLAEFVAEHRERNRAFETDEMRAGGRIQGLVYDLVKGL